MGARDFFFISLLIAATNGILIGESTDGIIEVADFNNSCTGNNLDANYFACNEIVFSYQSVGYMNVTCNQTGFYYCWIEDPGCAYGQFFPFNECLDNSTTVTLLKDYPVISDDNYVIQYYNDSDCETLAYVETLGSSYCIPSYHQPSQLYVCEHGEPRVRQCLGETCDVCLLPLPFNTKCQDNGIGVKVIYSCGYDPKIDYNN